MKEYFLLLIILLSLSSCDCNTNRQQFSLNNEVTSLSKIGGKKGNSEYLYVTAGNSLYSIGNQKGGFPEIGFHVEDEMAGIWYHPIKLLDGFQLSLKNGKSFFPLDSCSQFVAYPLANQFQYQPDELEISITRTDFIPDSLPVLIVEYQIKNLSQNPQNIELQMEVNSDIMPVWLGERKGIVDADDTLISNDPTNTILFKDLRNNWFAGVKSEFVEHKSIKSSASKLKGNGICAEMQFKEIELDAGQSKLVRFHFSGSIHSANEVIENLDSSVENLNDFYRHKKERYEKIEEQAQINIPDTLFMKAYQWGKYNTDWLIRDVPGMGQGLSAGLPDYPWFFSNDQAYTFLALLGTRNPDLFYNSWEMIKRISDKFNNGSGQIVHEASSNGVVYDKGRMEESQAFIITAWNIFKWYGDIKFLETYYEHGKKVWQFLQENDINKNLFVEGYGGTEIEGLNDEMLDVAVYTQVFLQVMSEAAEVLGKRDEADNFEAKANLLKKKINEDWWNSTEKRFADFKAGKEKTLQLIDLALEKRVSDKRNNWGKAKLLNLKMQIEKGKYPENSYSVFYNASTLLPLSEGIADPEKAKIMLETMPFFTNKFGLYVAGIARPDDIHSEERSVSSRLEEGFNYNEAIMTVGTSQLVMAECRYRGIDRGMEYIHQILNNFSFATPGSIYEVSPDYGMFVQAWNICGINIPLIQYIFGVEPLAYKKEVIIEPHIPSDWSYATLSNLIIKDNFVSIDFKKEGNKKIFTITSAKNDWNFTFPLQSDVIKFRLNGNEFVPNESAITFSGQKNIIELY